MVRFVAALVFASALTAIPALADTTGPAGAMQLPPQPKVRPAGMPAGYLMVSPCVAGMGEHWANPENLSEPIYGTWQGKIVFSEIMMPLSKLQSGVSLADLQALPGYTIEHIDFKFEPNGHPGMTEPHYDLHMYYVSAADQAAICPDGIPDSSMKATNE
jgi:hypothetical protein